MSKVAPWLALSTDWADSEMFDGATDGERLAWVLLLCHAKAHGRGGRVAARKSALIRTWRISERAYDGMLNRAQKCGAVQLDGETITLVNWRTYQRKASLQPPYEVRDSPEIETNRQKRPTDHTSQITPPKPPATVVAFDNFWSQWPRHHRKANRIGCQRKWVKDDLDSQVDRVMAGLRHWMKSPDWTKNGGEFIPAPLAWLNQRKWDIDTTGSEQPRRNGRMTDEQYEANLIRADALNKYCEREERERGQG